MKTVLLLCAALWVLPGPAQAQRVYNQAELDALLAPIALYPDALVSQILMAATYPEEVAEAARWSRANPHLKGDDAVRAAQGEPWDPAVKAMLAFPELLARMDESPQWTRELGEAFLLQQPHVMETVQGLRRRAQASGNLRSTDQYHVQHQGETIIVQPAHPQVVYVHHYDPFVVYGPWWWAAHRPVFWRPWPVVRVFVSPGFHSHRHHLRPRVVHHHHRPQVVPHHGQVVRHHPVPAVKPHVRVPEAVRRPIVHSTPQLHREHRQVRSERQMPAAHGFSHGHRDGLGSSRHRGGQRSAPRREAHRNGRRG